METNKGNAKKIVGIDLGTFHSVATFATKNNVGRFSKKSIQKALMGGNVEEKTKTKGQVVKRGRGRGKGRGKH